VISHIGNLAFILSLAAQPALAWKMSEDFRGLHLYNVSDGPITLDAVCDPEGAFQPPSNHLAIKKGEVGKEGAYRLASKTQSYDGVLVGGTDISSGNDKWSALVAVLQSSQSLSLTLDGEVFEIDTKEAFPTNCGAK